MIKLILSVVALVLIGLSLYVYMDKESTPSTQPAAHKAVAVEQPSIKDEPTKTASVKKVEQVAREEEKKASRVTFDHQKPNLTKATIQRIEAEVKGEYKPPLDDATIQRIEAEAKGDYRLKLDPRTAQKIEAEVNGAAKPQLDTATVRKIEAEANEHLKPVLNAEAIHKIETEVGNSVVSTK